MNEQTPREYQAVPAKLSVVAIAALAVGGLSLPLFFLGIPAVIGLVLAVVAYRRIEVSPGTLAGLGIARVGGYMALASLLLFLVMLFMPARGRSGLSNRSYCATNIRGIVQSMVVYAAENSNVFPVVPYAAYSPVVNSPMAFGVAASPEETLQSMYERPTGNIAGSPVACLWILVLKQQLMPKQLLCKMDPFVAPLAAPISEGGKFFNNVGAANQISYSIAYPWTTSGRVGPWWRNTMDSALPLMSDMAPMEGTGTPARTLGVAAAPGRNAMWNSSNHNGDGQTVGYGDVHATFERVPTVGHNQDNIFTASRTGRPQQFGGTPVTTSFRGVVVPADATITNPAAAVLEYGGPYDTVMLPVRNCSTGGL